MQANAMMGRIEQAFHSMSDEAAIKFCEMGEMLAETYPRPVTIELVKTKTDRNVELLREFGELSPAGLCLINWNTRLIEWSNGAYKRTFLDAVGKQALPGVRVGELVPEFTEQGLDVLFDRVAATGEPFIGTAFPLLVGATLTHWDCSLSLFPSTDGATYLFLQLQRALAPAKSMAA